MRILCTADVHIGRSSTCDGEIDCETSALAAWERIVDKAIEGKAEAVVIAGDLYDDLPAQYQTRPRVVRAFERLRDKGIPAIAVAGNHDHHALPEFCRAFDGLLKLCGPRAWEEVRVNGVRFVGRSFAAQYENQSLLENFALSDGGHAIGVVHADINATSRYAPTPVAHFAGRGVAAWVVGHVHLPCEWTDATPVAYTGSPQALDWGEVGSHGYRWLTIEHGKAQFSPVQAISTVRYQVEEIELDLGEDLQGRLAEKAAAYGAAHDGTESIRFRVHVRLKKGATLPAALADEPGMIAANGFAYCVRSVTNVPEVNLHLEAQNSDARGQAARLLLGLDGKGQPEWRTAAQELVRKIESQMQVERTNLRLLDDEALDFLRTAAPDEAQFAVKKVLEDVLALQEAR